MSEKQKVTTKEKINNSRQEVADYLINKIMEEKQLPWQNPINKKTFYHHNPNSGTIYKGGNALKLFVTAEQKGYQDNRWVTFKQGCEDYGLSLKKGEKATTIEYWKILEEGTKEFEAFTKNWDEEKLKALVHDGKYYFHTYANVFNAEQFHSFPPQQSNQIEYDQTQAVFESIIKNSEAPISYHSSDKNYYLPATDQIYLSHRNSFKTMEAYYNTAMHEIAHSTGHESRLDRFNKESSKQKLNQYAEEELVAEFSAAFLKDKYGLDISKENFNNNAAYLESWATAIKKDPDIIYRAASNATKVVEYVEEKMLDKELLLEKPQKLEIEVVKEFIREQNEPIVNEVNARLEQNRLANQAKYGNQLDPKPDYEIAISVDYIEGKTDERNRFVLGGGERSLGYATVGQTILRKQNLSIEDESKALGGHIYEQGKQYRGQDMKQLLADIAKDDITSSQANTGYYKTDLTVYLYDKNNNLLEKEPTRIDIGDGNNFEIKRDTNKSELVFQLTKKLAKKVDTKLNEYAEKMGISLPKPVKVKPYHTTISEETAREYSKHRQEETAINFENNTKLYHNLLKTNAYTSDYLDATHLPYHSKLPPSMLSVPENAAVELYRDLKATDEPYKVLETYNQTANEKHEIPIFKFNPDQAQLYAEEMTAKYPMIDKNNASRYFLKFETIQQNKEYFKDYPEIKLPNHTLNKYDQEKLNQITSLIKNNKTTQNKLLENTKTTFKQHSKPISKTSPTIKGTFTPKKNKKSMSR